MSQLREMEQWKKLLEGKLPGEEAQERMAPDFRGEKVSSGSITEAAVLALMYPMEERTGLVFMKRNSYDGPHSAQVSFPGGAREEEDRNLAQTALRECREELGVKENIEILGPLSPLHIPISSFLVSPFVGYCAKRPVFDPDPSEVKYVIETSVEALMDPSNQDREKWNLNDLEVGVPFYRVEEDIIWGATAMILSEFLQLASSF